MFLINCLSFLGKHARLCLPIGLCIALILPDLGEQVRDMVPLVIIIIYASAMIRLDLGIALRGAVQPHRILQSLGLSLVVLILIPCLFVFIARSLGLAEMFIPVLIWYAVAPPIASTVWMCLLLGFRPVLAMELVAMTSLIAPLSGPFVSSLFLANIAPIDPFGLLTRLGLMIVIGGALALLGQRLISRKRIDKHHTVFDGISTCAMLIFLIPVFNGVSTQISISPVLAGQLLGLAVLMNFGSQLFMTGLAIFLRAQQAKDTLKVMAVIAGNRNVGLYYAALPYDPVMGLFTAMYQVPLYLTPLFLGWLSRIQNQPRNNSNNCQ